LFIDIVDVSIGGIIVREEVESREELLTTEIELQGVLGFLI